MSFLALLASYAGVAVATVIGCKLAGMVDGGCDGSQFLDRNRVYDWSEEQEPTCRK